MSRFDRAFLNQVLARTSIIEIIGRKVTWDKKKSNMARGDYWACCPFHGEKSPSFHATEAKGQYHCFGCGVHGNAFDFIMETENLGFSETVERLANFAGIDIPKETEESKERASKTTVLMAILAAARKIYEEALLKEDGKIARNYLIKRGIAQNEWENFGLGFSPNTKNYISSRLTAQGFLIEDIIDAGLMRKNDDNSPPYDLFRNRLMFAIEDGQGKTISFGARTLEKDGMPKYLNGPESPVFSKGYNLYRYNIARAKAKNSPLIIAEGYMDVIALERAGFAAVAPLGTALTEDQLRLAWRAKPKPILCFDGDDAGKRAASRALERALPLINTGKLLGFVQMPIGQDPDDIIKSQGRVAMAQLIEEAIDLPNFIFQNEKSEIENLNSAEGRAKLRVNLRMRNNEIKDEDLKVEIRHEIKVLFDKEFDRTQSQASQFTPNNNINYRNNKNKKDMGASNELRNMVKKASEQIDKINLIQGDILNIFGAIIKEPRILDRANETIALLRIDNLGLDSLRHGILDVFHSQEPLDFSSLKHHFTKTGNIQALEVLKLLQKQPINPFYKKGQEFEVTYKSWALALEKYVAKRALALDAKELQAQASAGEEKALYRLGQIVSERRRLKTDNE